MDKLGYCASQKKKEKKKDGKKTEGEERENESKTHCFIIGITICLITFFEYHACWHVILT